MNPHLELREMINDEKKDTMAWRNMLNPHTTKRKDKLINTLDDHFICHPCPGGFRVRLSLPASFVPGDCQVVVVESDVHGKKKEAEADACALALVELLLRDPDKVILVPATFRDGEDSISRIRKFAHGAEAKGAGNEVVISHSDASAEVLDSNPSPSKEDPLQSGEQSSLSFSSSRMVLNDNEHERHATSEFEILRCQLIHEVPQSTSSLRQRSGEPENKRVRTTPLAESIDAHAIHGHSGSQSVVHDCIDGGFTGFGAASSRTLELQPKTQEKTRCAFVCVLWHPGHHSLNGLVADALTLGHQLRNSKHDRLILASCDMFCEPSLDVLRSLWQIRKIQHVNAADFMFSKCVDRFNHVFTKLAVMELDEFSKIVLLDADLLPRGNVDELFDFPAPSAIFRGCQDHTPGEARPRHTFYKKCFLEGSLDRREACSCKKSALCNHRELLGGINAGVVVLQPCRLEFKKMRDALWDRGHPCHVASSGPEQDFLTRWYDDRWHSFPRKFNWQLHQSSFVHRTEDLKSDRFFIEYEDLRILHFSTVEKPSAQLFNEAPRDVYQMSNASEERHGEVPNNKIRQWLYRAQKEWYEAFRDAWMKSMGVDCEAARLPAWRSAGSRCLDLLSQ